MASSWPACTHPLLTFSNASPFPSPLLLALKQSFVVLVSSVANHAQPQPPKRAAAALAAAREGVAVLQMRVPTAVALELRRAKRVAKDWVINSVGNGKDVRSSDITCRSRGNVRRYPVTRALSARWLRSETLSHLPRLRVEPAPANEACEHKRRRRAKRGDKGGGSFMTLVRCKVSSLHVSGG